MTPSAGAGAAGAAPPASSPEELSPEVREALAGLVLVLADNKRLLGVHYSDWILGAPTLEAGIACCAMAQDEWGHGRILYALLRDFGLDPDALEHERGPAEYRSSELLDRPGESWPELVALNLLFDAALTVQCEALAESHFQPVHHKVTKMLDEERFHFEHGRGWAARLGQAEKGRAALKEAAGRVWEASLRWFGPDDDPAANLLAEAGISDARPPELRRRWLERVAPVVEAAGLSVAERDGSDGWRSRLGVEWTEWDPHTRRHGGGPGPDEEELLSRVRGDRNRALRL